jgi:hypothetical protein
MKLKAHLEVVYNPAPRHRLMEIGSENTVYITERVFGDGT